MYWSRNSSREAFRRSDLVELALLLGKGLTDDLAGLLVSVVADLLSVVTGLGDHAVSGLLCDDEDLGDLALGGGGGDGSGSRGLGDGSGSLLVLELGNLGLGGGKLLLGGVQATLEVCDLLEHRVDLARKALEEVVNLVGVIAVLGGREGELV